MVIKKLTFASIGAPAGLLVLTLTTAPAMSAAPARQSFAATCAAPVSRGDSAASLLRRFAGNARRETLPGAEGETMPGVVLYPRDPQRRIEVAFSDARLTQVSTLTLRGATSVWSVGGMALGDGIDQITSSNGRGFALTGFEWDYGGSVIDLKGGALSRLPGGCTLTIRFSPPANATSTPQSLMGDVRLESTNPALRHLRPVVIELSLNWR